MSRMPAGDRARGDQHDVLAAGMELGDLRADAVEHVARAARRRRPATIEEPSFATTVMGAAKSRSAAY